MKKGLCACKREGKGATTFRACDGIKSINLFRLILYLEGHKRRDEKKEKKKKKK